MISGGPLVIHLPVLRLLCFQRATYFLAGLRISHDSAIIGFGK